MSGFERDQAHPVLSMTVKGSLHLRSSMSEFNIDGMVDKFYQMNPEEDGILFDGSYIKSGMRILIESHRSRINIASEIMTNYEYVEALEMNRWCEVGKVGVFNRSGVHLVEFLALYDDGTVIKRKYAIEHAWYVKKATSPIGMAFEKFGDISEDEAVALVDKFFGEKIVSKEDVRATVTNLSIY
jgi:hypothetical protein